MKFETFFPKLSTCVINVNATFFRVKTCASPLLVALSMRDITLKVCIESVHMIREITKIRRVKQDGNLRPPLLVFATNQFRGARA